MKLKNLDPYQKEILEYDGDIMLCKGRRVGGTELFSIKAVEAIRKGKRVVILSLTEDQAKLIIIMAMNYMSRLYPNEIDKTALNKPTQNRIVHKKGGWMIVRPVGIAGDGARAYDADILAIDEAPLQPEKMWAAARPIIATNNGRIWMWGTPKGKVGYFWDQWKEAYIDKKPDARFKAWYKNTEQVLEERPVSESWTKEQQDGLRRVLSEDRKSMSDLEYGQEYLGLFMEDFNSFLSDEVIERVCIAERPATPPAGKYYSGHDLARLGGDEITHEIFVDVGNKIIQTENIVKKHQLTPEIERDIAALNEIWKMRKIGLDAGSGTLGVSIFDHLMETNMRHKLVAMNNRSMSLDDDDEKMQKMAGDDYYWNMKSMMEHGECILLNDDNLKTSLRSLQMELVKTAAGHTRQRIVGRYMHIAEGIKRGLWLAKKEKSLNLFAY